MTTRAKSASQNLEMQFSVKADYTELLIGITDNTLAQTGSPLPPPSTSEAQWRRHDPCSQALFELRELVGLGTGANWAFLAGCQDQKLRNLCSIC